MKKSLIGSAVLTTACLGAMVFAQDVKTDDPKPLSEPLRFSAPLGEFKITPLTLGKGTFNINASLTPIVPLLEAVAKAGNLKLILSDEVKNQRLLAVDVNLKGVSAQQALEHIASTPGLSWGKVGADTYLVVTQKVTSRAYTTTLVQPSPKLFLQPELDKPTPNAQPFEFNGQRYYFAPLQNGPQKLR